MEETITKLLKEFDKQYHHIFYIENRGFKRQQYADGKRASGIKGSPKNDLARIYQAKD